MQEEWCASGVCGRCGGCRIAQGQQNAAAATKAGDPTRKFNAELSRLTRLGERALQLHGAKSIQIKEIAKKIAELKERKPK